MRDFRYIIGLGALLLSAVLSTSSCTDGNDWETDSAYARLSVRRRPVSRLLPRKILRRLKFLGKVLRKRKIIL